MKTWAEVRNETINLGFEKIKAYEKNKSSYIEAYNWRQNFIASTYDNIFLKIELEKEDNDTNEVFDIKEMAEMYGNEFAGISPSGVVDENNNVVSGISFTSGRLLNVSPTFSGAFTVYAKVLPKKLTVESEDTTKVEISDKWRNLMPYLMANRLFLDDNASTAGYYWNLFEDMKNQILANEYNPVSAVVVDGVDIDNNRWWF